MKKRFFGTLLTGAFLIASVSTFVSCKDYDDDIKNLQTQIDLKAEKTALAQAESTLRSEIAALKSQLEDADAKLKLDLEKKNSDEVARAIAAESLLETRIKAAEDALSKLTDLQSKLDGKVDLDDYNDAVTDIYAKIAAINGEDGLLAQLSSSISALEKGLNDSETGVKAAVENLKLQVAAMSGYEARIAAIENNVPVGDATLNTKLASLKQEIVALIPSVSGYAKSDDVTEISNTMNSLANKLNSLMPELDGIVVYVDQVLRSLVFIPESYNGGVEATSMKIMNFYKYYNFTNANYTWSINADGKSYKTKETRGYTDDTVENGFAPVNATATAGTTGYADASLANQKRNEKHHRYDSIADFKVMTAVARYHMNPSSAKLTNEDVVTVLDYDKEYITRASEAELSVKSWEAKNGELFVNLDVKDRTKIKTILDDKQLTTFATQVNLGKKKDNTVIDTVITSDYATLLKQEIYNVRLALKATDHSTKAGDATKADATNPVMNTHCGVCALDAATAHKSHLMASTKEAADFLPQYLVAYDEVYDLAQLIEVHYDNAADGSEHKKLESTDMTANGLEYKFELVGLFLGTNTTSESAHAALSGSKFHPQDPTINGDQTAYDETVTADPAKVVDRTPVVRVALIQKENNIEKVIDYGYIRIKIVNKVTPDDPILPVTVGPYNGNWSYTYAGECVDPAQAVTIKNTWAETEYHIYSVLGLTRQQFVDYYEVEGTDADLQQYYTEGGKYYKVGAAPDGTASTAVKYSKLGTISHIPDLITETGAASNVVQWALTGAQAKAAFVDVANKAAQNSPQTRAMHFQPKSTAPAGLKDVYVNFTLTTTSVEFKLPSGQIDWDGNKNNDYWYADNAADVSASRTDNDEIHANTKTPEDFPTLAKTDELTDLFSDVFTGNHITGSFINPITDNTSGSEYAASKLALYLIFSSENNGKIYKGVDGKEYKVRVKSGSSDKTLEARIVNSAITDAAAVWQDIANIVENTTGLSLPADAQKVADNTYIEWIKDTDDDALTYAEALLNYKGRYELASDVVRAIITAKAYNKCATPMELSLDAKTFDVRFLRPLNVYSANKTITDASTGTLQTLNLKELVKLSDWRGTETSLNFKPQYPYDAADADGYDYFKFYDIVNILVDGATASTDLAEVVETNMNQTSTETFVKLKDVTTQLDLAYTPVANVASPAWNSIYGTITYRNLSSTVGTFKLRIPVKVVYEWGWVVTKVDVTVNKTAARRR